MKLTVLMTHPVQYFAPWFRHIAESCTALDLTVLYATQPLPEQQGVGFGKAFEWDVPLTDGYDYRILRPARETDDVHSNNFWGLDVPEAAAAVEESRPDVVLINGWYSVTLLRALWTSRRLRLPVLYRGDTHLGSAPAGWRRAAWAAKTRVLLSMFSGYLTVGVRNREYLKRFGVADERIFESPHCVDNKFFAEAARPHQTDTGRVAARESFGFTAEDFVVLFVGKLEPNKRPLDLIRAVASMGPGAPLLVVGSGPLEVECRAEAQRLGVRVTWAGFMNQSELGRAYAVADCLALPSGSETWGLVVNEALATGLPCVVTDQVGCAPDLIRIDQTGEVVPLGDTEKLTASLRKIRLSRAQGHDWATACMKQIEAYSFEAATRGLLRACDAVATRF